MKILDRYIYSSILKTVIIVILALSLVLAGVELFTRIDSIVTYHISFMRVVEYLLLSLPQYLMLMASFSFLFASTLFFSSLSGNNERIALLNAGVGKKRISRPIIILAILFTILGIFFQETFLVDININHDRLAQELFGSTSTKDSRNIALKDDNGNLIFANRFNEKENTIYSPILVIRDNNNIEKRIEAESAVYSDGKWIFSDAIVYSISEYGEISSSFEKYLLSEEFILEPEFLKSQNINVETMDYKTALSYLSRLKSVDKDAWYEKCSSFIEAKFKPFGILILVLMSCLLSYNYKKNILILSIGKSLAIMVVYYISNMLITIICKQGVAHPVFCAIIPILGSLLATILINLIGRLIHKE